MTSTIEVNIGVCSAMNQGDDDPLLEFLKTCDQNPASALEWYENLEPDLRNREAIKVGQLIALRNLATAKFVETGGGVLIGAVFDEISDRFDEEHVKFAEAGIKVVAELEALYPGFVERKEAETDPFLKTMIDEIATVLNQFRPGQVQEILGWTKIRYFGANRTKSLAKDVPPDLVAAIGKKRFSAPITIRSAILMSWKGGPDRSVVLTLLELPFEAKEKIGDLNIVGSITLRESETNLVRLMASDATEQEEPEPAKGKSKFTWKFWVGAAVLVWLLLSLLDSCS